MPLTKSSSPQAFKSNLKAELNAGKKKNQALAIAFAVQRRAKKAKGGPLAALPFSERSMMMGMKRSLEHQGMIHSPVAGRTDRLPMSVRSGAYVIPSDIVSALGQGNSAAGANGLNQQFKMGPYGTSAGKAPHAMTPKMAKLPGMGAPKKPFADGGDVDSQTPGASPPVDIVAAGGEFVVPPEKVAEVGGGDVSHGHNILDAMVAHVRKKNIKTLRKLPKPKKN